MTHDYTYTLIVGECFIRNSPPCKTNVQYIRGMLNMLVDIRSTLAGYLGYIGDISGISGDIVYRGIS